MITAVSELKGEELIKNIHNGIIRKLQSAKQLAQFDKEISAGLYTYALEEFGKLLLVKASKQTNNTYRFNYRDFIDHNKKFTNALDYLEANHHVKCYVLNNEGDFDAESFSRKGFDLGLLPDFKARLSIFYSDFKTMDANDIDIVKIPTVDRNSRE